MKIIDDRIVTIERKARIASTVPSFAGFDPFVSSLPVPVINASGSVQGLERLFETLAQRVTVVETDLSTRPSLEGNDKNVCFGSLNVSTIQDTEVWLSPPRRYEVRVSCGCVHHLPFGRKGGDWKKGPYYYKKM